MSVQILIGDVRDRLKELPDASVHCCVTSPPYFGLRDYGVAGQIGLEKTPDAYVATLVEVFREARRVLKDTGTLWLNLGDSYAGSNPTRTRAGGFGGPEGLSVTAGETALFRHGNLNKNQGNSNRDGLGSVPGLKPKDLIGIPWRVAFALQADGWYLRQDIIWSKPNPMPESVRDRCTKAHEYLFMLSKSARYHYEADAIAEPAIYSGLSGQDESGFKDPKKYNGKHSDKQRGHSRRHAGFNGRWDAMEKAEQCSGLRNKRSVWEVATQPFSEAHFATFPPALIEPCILAGCPIGGTVLDCFGGAGTTGLVADRHQRNAILIELNPEYAAMAERRIAKDAGIFNPILQAAE